MTQTKYVIKETFVFVNTASRKLIARVAQLKSTKETSLFSIRYDAAEEKSTPNENTGTWEPPGVLTKATRHIKHEPNQFQKDTHTLTHAWLGGGVSAVHFIQFMKLTLRLLLTT